MNNNIKWLEETGEEIAARIPLAAKKAGFVPLDFKFHSSADAVLYGSSSQETTKGYNIFPHTSAGSWSENGIDYTSDGKGTYTLVGTATAKTDIIFDLPEEFTIPISVGSGGSGVFYLFASASSTASIVFRYNSTKIDSWTISNRYTSGYSTMGGKTTNRFDVSIASGLTIDLTLQIMFVDDGSTAHTFEPYTGGIASPNPDYPQEITSVEEENFTVKDADGNVVSSRVMSYLLRSVGSVRDVLSAEGITQNVKTMQDDGTWAADYSNFRIYSPVIDDCIYKDSNCLMSDRYHWVSFSEFYGHNVKGACSVSTTKRIQYNATSEHDTEAVFYYQSSSPLTISISSDDAEFLRQLANLPEGYSYTVTDQDGNDISSQIEPYGEYKIAFYDKDLTFIEESGWFYFGETGVAVPDNAAFYKVVAETTDMAECTLEVIAKLRKRCFIDGSLLNLTQGDLDGTTGEPVENADACRSEAY